MSLWQNWGEEKPKRGSIYAGASFSKLGYESVGQYLGGIKLFGSCPYAGVSLSK